MGGGRDRRGPTSFPLSWERFERLGPAVYAGILAGPVVASVVLTTLLDGRRGLRVLLARLGRWRVGWRWYAAAVAPAIVLIALLAILSLADPRFVPLILVSEHGASTLLLSLLSSILFALFEEIGWTGFAVPRLRRRHGFIASGVVLGLCWGLWHFPLFWERDSFAKALPLSILMARLFSWLPGFRVLMVWLYDRTHSVLLAVVMHASLVTTQLVFAPAPLTGTALLVHLVAWMATIWGMVGILALHERGATARLRAWMRRRSATSYFVLAFAISWGGIVALVGPRGLLAKPEVFASLVWVAPLIAGPAVAGLVMTTVVGGVPALRDLGRRLLRWRVGARWWGVAIAAPFLLAGATALVLSLWSREFLPPVVLGEVSQLGVAIGAGLSAGILEELGWTGFAIPALRRRYSATTTGLVVGLLWRVWHVVPKLLGQRAMDTLDYAPVDLLTTIATLTAFRVLMVWVYDRTHGLAVAMLMHAGLTASLFIVQPVVHGTSAIAVGITQAVLAWVAVGGVALRRSGELRSRIGRVLVVSETR